MCCGKPAVLLVDKKKLLEGELLQAKVCARLAVHYEQPWYAELDDIRTLAASRAEAGEKRTLEPDETPGVGAALQTPPPPPPAKKDRRSSSTTCQPQPRTPPMPPSSSTSMPAPLPKTMPHHNFKKLSKSLPPPPPPAPWDEEEPMLQPSPKFKPHPPSTPPPGWPGARTSECDDESDFE